MKPETLNLIEEEAGNNLKFTGTGKDLLNRTSLTLALRSKISKQIS